jgi:hypothetical protein
MALILALLHAIPVLIAGGVFRSKSAVWIVSIIMILIGVFTGSPAYAAADIIAVTFGSYVALGMCKTSDQSNTFDSSIQGEAPQMGAGMLPFKSNEAAFEYACRFLETKIEIGRPIPGIVLKENQGPSETYVVKVANANDFKTNYSEEEIQQLCDIKVPEALKYVALLAPKADRVRNLKKNDLVMFMPAPQPKIPGLEIAFLNGGVLCKIDKVFDMKRGFTAID